MYPGCLRARPAKIRGDGVAEPRALALSAASLLRDIVRHRGLAQGGEQSPNAEECVDMWRRLEAFGSSVDAETAARIRSAAAIIDTAPVQPASSAPVGVEAARLAEAINRAVDAIEGGRDSWGRMQEKHRSMLIEATRRGLLSIGTRVAVGIDPAAVLAIVRRWETDDDYDSEMHTNDLRALVASAPAPVVLTAEMLAPALRAMRGVSVTDDLDAARAVMRHLGSVTVPAPGERTVTISALCATYGEQRKTGKKRHESWRAALTENVGKVIEQDRGGCHGDGE